MAVRSLGQLGAAETVLAIIQSKQSETKNPTMGITETDVSIGTISALAATGGERAIPFLHQAWKLDIKHRKYIIQAFSWLGTNAAIDKIKELLAPSSIENAILWANHDPIWFTTGLMTNWWVFLKNM